MARRWWVSLLVAAVVLPLLVWGCDRFQEIRWVGNIDLLVEFTVTDTTGSPVRGAQVEVRSEGGFYAERNRQEFALVAGIDGVARKECLDNRCSGSTSGLGFTETFGVYRPWWRYRVIAAGYEPTEWIDLESQDLRGRTRRSGRGKAVLVVPVSLPKRLTGPNS